MWQDNRISCRSSTENSQLGCFEWPAAQPLTAKWGIH